MVSPTLSENRPAETQAALRAVEAALRAGDMPAAARLADEAVGRGIEHASLLTLASYARISRGDDANALDCATRACALAPHSADALNARGFCLARLGRQREALAAYDAALRQQPGATHIRFRKAVAHEELSELGKARMEFERVLTADPGNAEVLAKLANLAAMRGDAKAARDHGARALKFDPRQQGAILSLAMADIEEKKFQDALLRVRPLAAENNASAINRSIALGLSGDALDGLGKFKDSFAAYVASNAILRAFYKSIYEKAGEESAHERVARLKAYFEKADAAGWQAEKNADYPSPVGTHVFLVGFPRSGTTLLEAVLDSHPQIQSMEERDCLLDALDAFFVPPQGLASLAAQKTVALAQYREAYWQHAAEFGAHPERPVFVDKLPLNSVLLPLVAKLFPRAKILFSLRDPRDVVLSCFRRRFGMNAQMYELTSLESAARYYDGVMALSSLYREKLGLDWLDLRYEDLVHDFDGTVVQLCAFLNVMPDPAMAKFADRARRNIDTPSNAQIARGLFTQGVGQWRAYADEMKPVLPLLEPWAARFGYEG